MIERILKFFKINKQEENVILNKDIRKHIADSAKEAMKPYIEEMENIKQDLHVAQTLLGSVYLVFKIRKEENGALCKEIEAFLKKDEKFFNEMQQAYNQHRENISSINRNISNNKYIH